MCIAETAQLVRDHMHMSKVFYAEKTAADAVAVLAARLHDC
jgi:hypothetical protein